MSLLPHFSSGKTEEELELDPQQLGSMFPKQAERPTLRFLELTHFVKGCRNKDERDGILRTHRRVGDREK